MSQQEMFSDEQQGRASNKQDTSSSQSYHAAEYAEGKPKEEPVSRYDEPMNEADYQHGYQSYQPPQPHQQASAHYDRARGYSPNGDAFEREYQPYAARQQWNVPSWARPQVQRKGRLGKFVLFFILGLLFIKPLLILIATIGFVILLPFLLVALVMGLVLVLAVPFLLLRAFSGSRRWRYTRGWRYGQWW